MALKFRGVVYLRDRDAREYVHALRRVDGLGPLPHANGYVVLGWLRKQTGYL